jgi:hypothetical protein
MLSADFPQDQKFGVDGLVIENDYQVQKPSNPIPL